MHGVSRPLDKLRYRQLGNSITPIVAQMIMESIVRIVSAGGGD